MKTPDGTPDENEPLFPGGSSMQIETPANAESKGEPKESTDQAEEEPAADEQPKGDVHNVGEAHPVGCLDCHDPETMQVRVTRPGFVLGIAALAQSDDPVPHLPSVERWRQGKRERPYDPNVDASRPEMRSFVCGQGQVEY